MRSLRTKMVMIMVLLILALMTVVGSFLINGVGNYYIEEFYLQMEQTFSQDFITQLQDLAVGPNGPSQMKQRLMSQSDLGIDLSRRNVYILSSDGQVLDSSNNATSVSMTANLLQAMNGEVGQSGSIASSIMDLAVPIERDDTHYIVYILDNKDTVNALTGRLFSIILQSLVLGLGICVVLAFLLSQILITPIRALTTGTRQVAAGELSQSLEVTSRDEIGMLTRNFNHMSQVLQSTISQVENERNKLSTLFLHMTDGVAAFDSTGHLIHHNPAASRMLSRELTGEDTFAAVFGDEHGRSIDERFHFRFVILPLAFQKEVGADGVMHGVHLEEDAPDRFRVLLLRAADTDCHTVSSSKQRARVIQQALFRSVDDLGVEVERVFVCAAVVGEERRARNDGEREGIDERVRRQVGDRRPQVGEDGLRRVDRKDALILLRLHVLHFEHAHKARKKVEGLGGFLRALDLAFEDDDVHLVVLVCLADLAGEHGFDLELGVGSGLDGVDLKGKLVCRESFQGVFDHAVPLLSSAVRFPHAPFLLYTLLSYAPNSILSSF